MVDLSIVMLVMTGGFNGLTKKGKSQPETSQGISIRHPAKFILVGSGRGPQLGESPAPGASGDGIW